ncbi:MAG: uroporphyrinogen-III C-methyltransferase [SAR324 cluster bacterium]|nr:uroporphyrinogen-III C-methyltransferase [SAR324 cluster bacterium]
MMLGKVIFVGAGPGNPELLTLEAYRVLQEADVVLYDALVGPEVLDLIPSRTQKIYVGKRATNHSHKQKEINELLLEMVTHHECVVRLKGGDTLIYARLTDELTVLQEAGIPYQVLAGVTTLSGTAAALGVPLTSRDCGSELLITTVSTYSDLGTCRAVTTFLKRGSGIAIYMPTFRGQHILPNLLE